MPFPPQMPAQVQDFVLRMKAVLGPFFREFAEQAARFGVRVLLVGDKLVRIMRPVKRRVFLCAVSGVLALGIAGISHLTKGMTGGQETAAGVTSQAASLPAVFIPVDDLFLPDEPDFIPGVTPEREQRTTWTAEDAASLWQDPLKNGEEQWRNRIEKTIDEIMESVP